MMTLIEKAISEARLYIAGLRDQKLLRQTAEDAGLKYDWLLMFGQGKAKNPTTKNIHKVLLHRESWWKRQQQKGSSLNQPPAPQEEHHEP